MPSFGNSRIVGVTLDAFQSSGAAGALISRPNVRPREFVVQTATDAISVRIYIQTITHGGGSKRPDDEFRIQNTAGVGALTVNPQGYTALLGYEPNTKVFAGFDIRPHQATASRSPSLQIKLAYLHQALSDGMAFYKKDNAEIVVAFRPDQLLNYVLNADELHRLGVSDQTFRLLSKASALEAIPETEIAAMPMERQRIIRTVSRQTRASNFSQKVRQAYDNRCAVTRMQLRLCDAAHILPVKAPGSMDEVRNGIFLSPTYHRAFDTGLIYLDEKLTMRLSQARKATLSDLGLDGGLTDFQATIGRRIHLPPDESQRPDPLLIRQANEYRRTGA